MGQSNLSSFGDQMKKIKKANEREEQRKVIRKIRFKASLVDDPLAPSSKIARAIETSRKS